MVPFSIFWGLCLQYIATHKYLFFFLFFFNLMISLRFFFFLSNVYCGMYMTKVFLKQWLDFLWFVCYFVYSILRNINGMSLVLFWYNGSLFIIAFVDFVLSRATLRIKCEFSSTSLYSVIAQKSKNDKEILNCNYLHT